MSRTFRILDEKPSGLSTLSIQGSSGTDVVLLKTESKERAYVNTVDTKIKACNAFNAMFVDTVNTGVCGSMRCENSAFGLSTLLIQI